jgi:hypothetical protein
LDVGGDQGSRERQRAAPTKPALLRAQDVILLIEITFIATFTQRFFAR